MNKRFLFLLAGGLVITTIFFHRRVSAQSVIDLTECQHITTSGSYRLAKDVSDPSTINTNTPSIGYCFSIRAGNVTFDGNGKTITSSTGEALEVADFSNDQNGFSNVTVSNVVSSGGVRAFGENINHVTFQNLQVGGIADYGSDDVIIHNNTVGEGGILVSDDDREWTAFRAIITGNTVAGGSTDVKVLVEVVGGQVHPCPELDTIITGNTITDTRNDPPPEATAAVRVRCATHTTFTNNTIHSTGSTLGLYLRDESDDGTYENNTFVTNSRPALWIAAGNPDKTYPSRNTFRNNVFQTNDTTPTDPDNGYLYYGLGIGSGNIFSYNTFISKNYWLLGHVGSTGGNTYNHNTFYAFGSGILQNLTGDTTAGPPSDTYTNNIFNYSGASVFGYDKWLASRYSGNHNLFYNRAGALSFGSFGTLAQWRTTTGSDAGSINMDPKITDATNGDFSLQAGSPALNTASDGTNIGAWQTSSCTSAWTCDPWQTCQSNNTQTRTCHDANTCQPPTNQPALTQSCDGTAPTVSITAPTNNTTVSGTVSATATASDNVGVVGVQFKLDGTNLGSEDTVVPYSTSWNTTTATNASHTLTAVARDAAGHTTTASTITVTVNNTVACVEDWTTIPCSDWSGCDKTSRTQSRTCTDNHHCGTFVNQPVLSQGCTLQDSTQPSAVSDLKAK